ncbi:unnamed protein product [Trichobilharzia szidati]|nr:unnamed protein product [Trichobilharzia szidati]
MSIFVTIPNLVENMNVLCQRLENYFGVSVSLLQDKLKLCGTPDKLNAAQDYALRFISPESVLVIILTSAECLELFSCNLPLIRHFESKYNIILIKNNNALIVKGSAHANKRFSMVIQSLESFSKTKCTYLSNLKVSILTSLCEKYSVKFADLQCSDSMKLALLDYFTSLEKPEVMTNGCSVDSPAEKVHFVEAYRNPGNNKPYINQNNITFNSSSSAKKSPFVETRLRPIIIDGSNVGFAHGKQKEFSAKGIRLALDYFDKRGHQDVVVVIPRHYQGKGGRYFDELEHSGKLTYTPSRTLNRERQTVYDDRIILQLAADKDAVIISNDQYRDLMSENAKFKELIETRLLPYVMSGNTFLLPEDPYGPKGPSLDVCLSMSDSTQSS